MNAYRVMLLGTIVVALLVALTVPVFGNTGATAVLSVIVLLEAVADVISTLYILRLVLGDRRRPRSWLLLMLFTTSTMVTVGFVAIGLLVALRFLGFPPLAGGAGLLITGMAIVLVGAVPIQKASLFAIVQHDPSARTAEATADGVADVEPPGIAPV